jgi:hypothetical protein
VAIGPKTTFLVAYVSLPRTASLRVFAVSTLRLRINGEVLNAEAVPLWIMAGVYEALKCPSVS